MGIGGNNTKPKRIHLTPLPPERVFTLLPGFEAIPSPMPFTSSARGGFSVNPPMPCLFYTCPCAATIPRHLPFHTKPNQAPSTSHHRFPSHQYRRAPPVSTQPQKSTSTVLPLSATKEHHHHLTVPPMMITHTNSDSAHHHPSPVCTNSPTSTPFPSSMHPTSPNPQTHKTTNPDHQPKHPKPPRHQ